MWHWALVEFTENQKLPVGLGTVRHPALAGDLLDQAAPAGVGVRVRSLADQASRYYSAEV